MGVHGLTNNSTAQPLSYLFEHGKFYDCTLDHNDDEPDASTNRYSSGSSSDSSLGYDMDSGRFLILLMSIILALTPNINYVVV